MPVRECVMRLMRECGVTSVGGCGEDLFEVKCAANMIRKRFCQICQFANLTENHQPEVKFTVGEVFFVGKKAFEQRMLDDIGFMFKEGNSVNFL